jgi:hypothetical protein
MTFDDKLSTDLTLMRSRLTAGMDDGMVKDSNVWNGLKQAVGGTISEKCVLGVFDTIDAQNWRCANSFDPDGKPANGEREFGNSGAISSRRNLPNQNKHIHPPTHTSTQLHLYKRQQKCHQSSFFILYPVAYCKHRHRLILVLR